MTYRISFYQFEPQFKSVLVKFILCLAFVVGIQSSVSAQLTQRDVRLRGIFKKIDSLRRDKSPRYEVHQMNNWAMMGQLFVQIGRFDSARKYFKLNYENTKSKQYDHFLNTLTVLELARVLKRQGFFCSSAPGA